MQKGRAAAESHRLLSRTLDGERGWMHFWSTLPSKDHTRVVIADMLKNCPELLQLIAQPRQPPDKDCGPETADARYSQKPSSK